MQKGKVNISNTLLSEGDIIRADLFLSKVTLILNQNITGYNNAVEHTQMFSCIEIHEN